MFIGFKKVFVGFETPSTESLEECRKMQNCGRDLVETVKPLQRAGLEVIGGFIVGFDNDPRDIFKRQFEFIQRSGVVTAMVGLLTALPETRLYYVAIKPSIKRWSLWPRGVRPPNQTTDE